MTDVTVHIRPKTAADFPAVRELIPGALWECQGMVVYARAFIEEEQV